MKRKDAEFAEKRREILITFCVLCALCARLNAVGGQASALKYFLFRQPH